MTPFLLLRRRFFSGAAVLFRPAEAFSRLPEGGPPPAYHQRDRFRYPHPARRLPDSQLHTAGRTVQDALLPPGLCLQDFEKVKAARFMRGLDSISAVSVSPASLRTPGLPRRGAAGSSPGTLPRRESAAAGSSCEARAHRRTISRFIPCSSPSTVRSYISKSFPSK